MKSSRNPKGTLYSWNIERIREILVLLGRAATAALADVFYGLRDV
jgi:hypothetical protein